MQDDLKSLSNLSPSARLNQKSRILLSSLCSLCSVRTTFGISDEDLLASLGSERITMRVLPGEGSVSAWSERTLLPNWHPANTPGLLHWDTHTENNEVIDNYPTKPLSFGSIWMQWQYQLKEEKNSVQWPINKCVNINAALREDLSGRTGFDLRGAATAGVCCLETRTELLIGDRRDGGRVSSCLLFNDIKMQCLVRLAARLKVFLYDWSFSLDTFLQ